MTTIPPTARSTWPVDAGAVVRREVHQGKGNVVRRMFADVKADIYVLVDGDATYDAASARVMIARLIEEQLDAVVAARVAKQAQAYRRGHQMGDRLLTSFFAATFNATFTDILSGYRVFSRRFVKSFPVLSSGFEIETELSVHSLDPAVGEVSTPYYARPEKSASKLNSWRDGLRILATIIELYRSERPLSFFSIIGVVLAVVSVVLAFRAYAAGLPLAGRRPRARYGDQGTAGDEASRLSAATAAERVGWPMTFA
jgi:hypothetical protein